MILSPAGRAFIAAFEGFRPGWYDDGTGVRTIGYGHTGPLPAGYTVPLAQARALELLAHDAQPALSAVGQLTVPGGFTQAQTDALCSFCFNLGTGYLTRGHLIYDALTAKPRLPWPANVRPLAAWRLQVRTALVAYDEAGGKVLPGLRRRRLAEGVLGFAADARPHYTVAAGNPYANA